MPQYKQKTKQKKATKEIFNTGYSEENITLRTVDNNDTMIELPTMKTNQVDDLFEPVTSKDVQINQSANAPAHRFSQRTNMKGKQSADEKKKSIQEDPFGMLANCYRFTSSKEMKRVKDALSKIDDLMVGNIPTDKSQFYKEQTLRVAAYNEVITHCDSYIQSKNPTTENGKRRMEMVKGIRSKCKTELATFESLSTNVFAEVTQGKQKSWLDILSLIRTEPVSLDDQEKNAFKKDRVVSKKGLSLDIDGKKKLLKRKEEYEDISSLDLANKEIENAAPDSIEEKLKKVLAKDPTLKEDFELGIKNAIYSEDFSFPSFIASINEDSLKEVGVNLVTKLLKINHLELIETVSADVESLKQFSEFLYGLQQNHNKNKICKNAKIKKGTEISSNKVASFRVANLLGVSGLIAESKNVMITSEIKGNLTDEVEGETKKKLYEEATKQRVGVTMSPEAEIQLQTLKVLDYLCGQVNRNEENYKCITDKTKEPWVVRQIIGIDNDMSFGELDLDRLESNDIGTLDMAFASNLMSLTPELLRFSLKDLLEEDALNAAVKRLETLQNVVKIAVKSEQTKIVNNNISIQEEVIDNKPQEAVSKKIITIDAKHDFISFKKVPIEKQILKSSAELIAYKQELMDSGKEIDADVMAWLDAHIKHWQNIEYLRANKPTSKPPRTYTVKRGGKKIKVDKLNNINNNDEVILDNVKQVGRQSYTNSCWSRVAQTLLNYQGVDIDQTDIRAFRKSGITEKNYDHIDSGSSGVFKNKVGSIENDVHELILQTTDKVGMRVMQYNPLSKTTEGYKLMQNEIMDEIKRAIVEYKTPVALVYDNHYRTIVGFRGNILLVKDPNKTDPDKVREFPISDIKGKAGLEWLQELSVDEEGHCEEIETRSKIEENESRKKWELENGKYFAKSISDGSYLDDNIGGMSTTHGNKDFYVIDMFKFNTKMK